MEQKQPDLARDAVRRVLSSKGGWGKSIILHGNPMVRDHERDARNILRRTYGSDEDADRFTLWVAGTKAAERGVAFVRSIISDFADRATPAEGLPRTVVLHACSNVTMQALRAFMEDVARKLRFIFIVHTMEEVIPAFHSRCVKLHAIPRGQIHRDGEPDTKSGLPAAWLQKAEAGCLDHERKCYAVAQTLHLQDTCAADSKSLRSRLGLECVS